MTSRDRDRLYARVINAKFGTSHGAAIVHAAKGLKGVFDHPLALTCAQVETESAGRNVFGHDPTIFVGAGEVTESRYRAYKAQRGTTRMQGVGLTQLTWWEFQDEADRLGGCWKPVCQLAVYVRFTRENVERYGKRSGIAHYNGSGFVAWAYAGLVLTRRVLWTRRFRKALKAHR